MAEDLNAYLEEFRSRRSELAAKPGAAWEILAEGASRVRPTVEELMAAVRRALHVDAE
jgi:hypothetical protein